MKKIIITSIVSAIFGIFFYGYLKYFEFLWGFQLLLVPMIPGMFLVLFQDEEKSYKFLPKLFLGAFITTFLFCFSLLAISFYSFKHSFKYSVLEMIIPMIPFFLFLFGLVVFGGLIGLVIRGTSLLLKKKNE